MSFFVLFFLFSSADGLAINDARLGKIGLENFQEVTQKSFLHGNLTSTSSRDYILDDRQGKISDQFKLNEYWRPRALFWFNIYSLYDLDSTIVHDKENLGLVYDIFDTKSEEFSEVHPFVHHKIKSDFKNQRIIEVRAMLARSTSGVENNFKNLFLEQKIELPIKSKKRLKQFQENVRAQSGQRSQIYAAILRFYPYQLILPYFAEKLEIPKELMAIPFLESSFNPDATSKVKAMGIWQIMPFIEKKFLSSKNEVIYLKNVILSSLVAFQLLKQNYNILKRWDLSVTAYNSGTKHLLKAKEKLKDPNISLEKIFQQYHHPHLGFASQNFYAEFLALGHALFYRELIYPLYGIESVDGVPMIYPEKLKLYLSKCTIKKPNTLLSIPSFFGLNAHIKKFLAGKATLPKGTIIVSLQELNEKEFFNIPESWWFHKTPKQWETQIKNYSCSTK